MGSQSRRVKEVLGDVMPGLGAVGGPCFRPVAGEPSEEGLLLPLSETKKTAPSSHTHIQATRHKWVASFTSN